MEPIEHPRRVDFEGGEIPYTPHEIHPSAWVYPPQPVDLYHVRINPEGSKGDKPSTPEPTDPVIENTGNQVKEKIHDIPPIQVSPQVIAQQELKEDPVDVPAKASDPVNEDQHHGNGRISSDSVHPSPPLEAPLFFQRPYSPPVQKMVKRFLVAVGIFVTGILAGKYPWKQWNAQQFQVIRKIGPLVTPPPPFHPATAEPAPSSTPPKAEEKPSLPSTAPKTVDKPSPQTTAPPPKPPKAVEKPAPPKPLKKPELRSESTDKPKQSPPIVSLPAQPPPSEFPTIQKAPTIIPPPFVPSSTRFNALVGEIREEIRDVVGDDVRAIRSGIAKMQQEKAKVLINQNRKKAEILLSKYYRQLDTRTVLRLTNIRYCPYHVNLRSATLDEKYLGTLMGWF